MDVGTENPRTSDPTPQATRATPLCARVVADAMDLTPSVPRRKSVPGRGIPRSPPGGPHRTGTKRLLHCKSLCRACPERASDRSCTWREVGTASRPGRRCDTDTRHGHSICSSRLTDVDGLPAQNIVDDFTCIWNWADREVERATATMFARSLAELSDYRKAEMSNLQEEIDRELWWPIRRAYNARDIDSLLQLYSPDVIRAGGPNSEILNFGNLAAAGSAWFAQLTADDTALQIDFRFTERLLDKDSASERGIFKMTTTKPNEPSEIIYGRFHVFLRRLGRWMIVVDYDSHDREPVSSHDFLAAEPVSAVM